jgi:hypothetical protein
VTDEFIEVTLRVAAALEASGATYLVGGSLASSAWGKPRSTFDVDLVVDMSEAQVAPFVAALEEGFYADPEAIRHAAAAHASTNLIHEATGIKVDLFFPPDAPLAREQMSRRRRLSVGGEPERFLYVYAPEDILLQKLRWYRLGNEVSGRQWSDVLGILAVQGSALDRSYLKRWAAVEGLSDLLERALRDARA